MKKLSILLLLIILGISVNAQKKSGVMYGEHEAINTTRAMWSTLIDGDRDAFVNYFADSVLYYYNGVPKTYPKETMGSFVSFWSGFENLEISDDHESFPDVLKYPDRTFVQDWLKFSGTHVLTGLNKDVNIHNIYGFDEAGKINEMYCYYDAKFIDEVKNASRTLENGKNYSSHPYIVKVRKMFNAYLAQDLDKWESFFVPNARFSYSHMKVGEATDLKSRKEVLQDAFDEGIKITLTQVGFPDCIYYEDTGIYTVYSWWTYRAVNADGKIVEAPMMYSHTLNKDGMITSQFGYYSLNHFE